MHVLLLCGGRSAEHEVSFQSASSVLKCLDQIKYDLSVIGIRKDGSVYSPDATAEKLKLDFESHHHFPSGDDWLTLIKDLRPQIVFPVLHGPNGEDGTVQGALEVLSIPYVGAGVGGSAVSMNKIYTKRILLQAGLPVLAFKAIRHDEWEAGAQTVMGRVRDVLDYPIFVKPANLGSSVGINKSTNDDDLIRHVDAAFQYDAFVIAEQGIEAREIETSVLGNRDPQVSVAGEVIPSREFYSYEAKYLDGNSELVIPASLTKKQVQRVQTLALETFKVLQLEGMARVDFLMEKGTNKFWINEANTLPGFTSISMYPKLWEKSGLSYAELLDRLIQLGLERYRLRNRFSVEL